MRIVEKKPIDNQHMYICQPYEKYNQAYIISRPDSTAVFFHMFS